MKTLNATPDSRSPKSTRMHWFMAVIGIVTAMTCSFVLFNGANANSEISNDPAFRTPSLKIENSNFMRELPVRSILVVF